ncbi:hypothetical protein [Myxosarcina sp. GI1]|uniref:DUF6930 domain-containing protein n=1 Tax=Myxosarcina sp. GI1 TaxID=1541065 RepID=UPI00055EA954|nr:hypothetical protein [Myxosarcina sp. GI1]
MTLLPKTTRSRLKNIPQNTSVWEGDRRSLGNIASHLEPDLEAGGECIIWVDVVEGSVRAMDIVDSEMGIEAIVRALLRAIESPQHPARPARPQKIVVRDREIQFFLRGVLQELEIKVEYAANLPLIDSLFQGFEQIGNRRPPALPPSYESHLENAALRVWQASPWELLADSDVLVVKLEDCAIDTVYLCIMGMMSSEYGVLFYRSLESLKQFRQAILAESRSEAQLEKLFLTQDCWFLNYEVEDDPDLDFDEVVPIFGSLHPYEGIRPFLDEEESKIVYGALETLLLFCRSHHQHLIQEPIAAISEAYQIELPPEDTGEQTIISSTISTVPELTTELLAIGSSDRLVNAAEPTKIDIPIQEDLIPDDSLVTLNFIPWQIVEQLKQEKRTYYQSLNVVPQGKKLPIILIQTTRPKAKATIERIKSAGGLKSVCFNPGEDPFSGDIFDLGMLQTKDGELYVFAEYDRGIPQELQAVQRWQRSCQKTHGYCGLVVSMGAKGNNRGNPQPKDMLAVFETKAVDGAELGLGILKLMPNFEF